MRAAAYLVLPSICNESFPLTIVKAFASGLPLIASRLDTMANILAEGKTGFLLESGSVENLARKASWDEEHPDAMREMSRNARREYEVKYTSEQN